MLKRPITFRTATDVQMFGQRPIITLMRTNKTFHAGKKNGIRECTVLLPRRRWSTQHLHAVLENGSFAVGVKAFCPSPGGKRTFDLKKSQQCL